MLLYSEVKQNLKWCNTIETVKKTRTTTTTIGPISKKTTTTTTTTLHVQQLVLLDNFARAAHFFVYVTMQLQRETSRNLLATCFMEKMMYVFLFTFFLLLFTVAHFQLGGR